MFYYIYILYSILLQYWFRVKKINEVFFSIFPRVLCKIPFKLPIAVSGSDMSERIQLKVKKTGGI